MYLFNQLLLILISRQIFATIINKFILRNYILHTYQYILESFSWQTNFTFSICLLIAVRTARWNLTERNDSHSRNISAFRNRKKSVATNDHDCTFRRL